jgi:hypothetical protein
LAAGVLAAGLNASYHDGGLEWAHGIADRIGSNSAAVLALASGRADQFLAEAQLVKARRETASCPFATTMARVQARVAYFQRRFEQSEAMSARHQAQFAKLQANRVRMESQVAVQAAHFRVATAAFAPAALAAVPVPVVCPRVRVNFPRLPMLKMPVAPEIHIEMTGTGPV